jgi:predicted AlkP superfamily phosphohydrolase/phosphomutase
VIAIGLDGFETAIARAMMRDGRLPMFRRLEEAAALFDLDHGDARETGLAWEHFATGQNPDGYARWSAVRFDPATYGATQESTRARPFLADLPCPVVAFDVPYLDLSAAPSATGLANWGAHDPGVARHAVPASLGDEIERRFGAYPAAEFIYGFVWPSPERTEEMADRLEEAVRARAEITRWLLSERLPDWRLAVTVVAEFHTAAEALWHGWDESHPLHGQPSAAAARRGVEAVYAEADRMIAALAEDHPDADLVVFSMHGMGPNHADVPSMALLPELMFRRRFGRPLLTPRADWALPVPQLRAGEDWSAAVNARLGDAGGDRPRRGLVGRLVRRAGRALRGGARANTLDWMPAARYRRFWPEMDAFALPAFYDGQIRVNLQGREARGRVAPDRYRALLDEIETLLSGLTDPVSGEPVVAAVDRPLAADPFDRSETRCDLRVHWRANAYAFDAPGIGRIGPVPQRRTGGHTGAFGYAAIVSPLLEAGRRNAGASSFDVAPTILRLLDLPPPAGLAGAPLR